MGHQYQPNEPVDGVAEPGSTYTFIAGGDPRVKERPRHGRNGVTFTPKATMHAERQLALQYIGPRFEGPIALDVTYEAGRQVIKITSLPDWQYFPGLRGDLDNYVKLTLDALQPRKSMPLFEGAFLNDRQVVQLRAEKARVE